MKLNQKTTFTLQLLFTCLFLNAQTDSHYWTHQYGAKGLLLNGAVIATADDETAIFYNPGAMAHNDNVGFTFSFLTPTYSVLQSKNFLTDGHTIKDTGIGFAPGFLGVRFKPFNTDKIIAGVTSFRRFKTDINYKDRVVEKVGEDLTSLFRGDLTFRRKLSEDWFGFGLAFNIGNNFGIGVTQFSSFHSQSMQLDFKKEILEVDNPQNVLLSWRSEFDYNLSIYSAFLTKVGMSFKSDKLCLGLTYTSPSYGYFKSSAGYAIDDQKINKLVDNSVTSFSNRKSVPVQEYKTPFAIGLGVDLHVKHDWQVSFSTEYFRQVDQFTFFEETDSAFDGLATGDDEIYVGIQSGNEWVVNVACGVQYEKSDKTTWIGGFRTDFNQSNNLLINNTAEYLSSTPNVFHLSGGGMLHGQRNTFSFGIDLGYGFRGGGAQLTDLSSISTENIFTFSGNNNVKNRYTVAMVFLTYDFLFK